MGRRRRNENRRVSLTAPKEVLPIRIGENEIVKYWLGVLNELKIAE